jgi:hypothetical protein
MSHIDITGSRFASYVRGYLARTWQITISSRVGSHTRDAEPESFSARGMMLLSALLEPGSAQGNHRGPRRQPRWGPARSAHFRAAKHRFRSSRALGAAVRVSCRGRPGKTRAPRQPRWERPSTCPPDVRPDWEQKGAAPSASRPGWEHTHSHSTAHCVATRRTMSRKPPRAADGTHSHFRARTSTPPMNSRTEARVYDIPE